VEYRSNGETKTGGRTGGFEKVTFGRWESDLDECFGGSEVKTVR
jgi:hypothetical protein